MPSLREIQSRIVSLRTTEKLTTAMKMISITKYRRALQSFNALDSFVKNFKETTKYVKPIPQGQEKYLIVMATERGLCGSLNTRLERFLKHQYSDYQIIIIGKISHSKANVLSHPKESYIPYFQSVIDSLKDYGEIKLVYVHFDSTSKHTIKEEQIFPWDFDPEQDYFSMVEIQDFDQWFKDYLVHNLYAAFSHTHISENASRMLAMDAASKNAQKLIQELRLFYNKKRQELITKEIMETGVSIYGE